MNANLTPRKCAVKGGATTFSRLTSNSRQAIFGEVTIGEAIRGWREVRGLSIEALADRAGIAKTSLQRYETNANSPTYHQLEKIAGKLDLTVAELVSGPSPVVREPSSPYRADIDHPRPVHTVAVPLYDGVPAGGWSPSAPERDGEHEVLHHLVGDRDGGRYVVVRVRGDSMYPRLLDGDLVLVDTHQRRPKSQQVVVAVYRGATTLKRYMVINRRPVLMPFNPDYQALEIDDPEDLRIIGVVTDLVHRAGV
jgi:repressor LexA